MGELIAARSSDLASGAAPPEQVRRRLAAILVADAKDYSLRMGRNEDSAYAAVRRCLALFREQITAHFGQTHGMTGDGLIAEFSSVVDAVRCAVAMQESAKPASTSVEEACPLQFRIAVTIGDVIFDAESIYGDSVNIAARMEKETPPGSICISRFVYDQVKNKLPFGYEYLGSRRMKNIEDPVEILRVRPDRPGALLGPNMRPQNSPLQLPALPSIAVLPFQDLGQSTMPPHLNDGIVEDIITRLSKFHELFVISRNSSFVYRDVPRDSRQIGQELGVKYLVEGSVRQAGNGIRVNAQLIDALRGHHMWADYFDIDLKDIVRMLDDVIRSIVSIIAVQLNDRELELRRRSEPADLEAYGCLLRGQEAFFRFTDDGNKAARQYYEQAIALDPAYARAYAALSRTLNEEWRRSWGTGQRELLNNAFALARRSIELDPTDARAHAEIAYVYLYRKEHDLSLEEFERALRLNPNDADIRAEFADALAYSGRPGEAVEQLFTAMRLNPHYPDWYLWHLAGAHYMLRDYDSAIRTAQAMLNISEARRILAASFAQKGMIDEARVQAEAIIRDQPQFSISQWALFQPDKYPTELAHFVAGLRAAGLPD